MTVDDHSVQGLELFRAHSPAFGFSFPSPPAENVLGVDPRPRPGISVSDGYWMALAPLPPGPHELHFEGKFVFGPGDEFPQDVTYFLTVVE